MRYISQNLQIPEGRNNAVSILVDEKYLADCWLTKMSQEIWHGQKIVIKFSESHPKFGTYFCTKYFEIGAEILSFGFDKSEIKIELI